MQNTVIVVDTNVWMDYFMGSRKGNEQAVDFVEQALCLDMALVIPPHCLSTLFFILQQELKAMNRRDGKLSDENAALTARKAAWAAIDFVLELASVGPTDQMDALIASKQRALHDDLEDNLVIACAMRTNARMLVTNDEKLIKHSPVVTMNARNAAALLSLE